MSVSELGQHMGFFKQRGLECRTLRLGSVATEHDPGAFPRQRREGRIGPDGVREPHTSVLAKRSATIEQYIWMYSSPDTIKIYAAFAGVTPGVATLTRERFFPKSALDPDHITGFKSDMEDGMRLKYLTAPLTKQQAETPVQLQLHVP